MYPPPAARITCNLRGLGGAPTSGAFGVLTGGGLITLRRIGFNVVGGGLGFRFLMDAS